MQGISKEEAFNDAYSYITQVSDKELRSTVERVLKGIEAREEIEKAEQKEEKEKYPNMYYWRKVTEALCEQMNVPR